MRRWAPRGAGSSGRCSPSPSCSVCWGTGGRGAGAVGRCPAGAGTLRRWQSCLPRSFTRRARPDCHGDRDDGDHAGDRARAGDQVDASGVDGCHESARRHGRTAKRLPCRQVDCRGADRLVAVAARGRWAAPAHLREPGQARPRLRPQPPVGTQRAATVVRERPLETLGGGEARGLRRDRASSRHGARGHVRRPRLHDADRRHQLGHKPAQPIAAARPRETTRPPT